MPRSSRFQLFVRLFTAAMLFASPQVFATTPLVEEPASPTAVDVTLGADGVLQGYVVNAQGVPAAKVDITLTTADGNQVVAVSDDKGRFGYRGLDGGSYQLETEHGVVLCRAWAATTAPPRSSATMLLVHDQQLVRGQWAAPPAVNGTVSRMKRVMTNPFAVAAIIGAAVAIPVAIHNADKDNSSS